MNGNGECLQLFVLKICGKRYRLGILGYRSLEKEFQSRWARFRGRPDPNALISTGAESNSSRDAIWAIKDVSLEVKQGEILGIIGHNGAGKSTLLKILSRVTAPTKGVIKMKGRVAEPARGRNRFSSGAYRSRERFS